MKIIQKFMKANDCYKVGRKIAPKGIMVHSTAVPGIIDVYKRQGDSLEFTTPSIEGTVMPLEDGTWEIHATFSTETAATSYLDSLFKQASS